MKLKRRKNSKLKTFSMDGGLAMEIMMIVCGLLVLSGWFIEKIYPGLRIAYAFFNTGLVCGVLIIVLSLVLLAKLMLTGWKIKPLAERCPSCGKQFCPNCIIKLKGGLK